MVELHSRKTVELTREDDGNNEDDKITISDGMMKMIGDDKSITQL